MSFPIAQISFYANVVGFLVALPTSLATYYQAYKIRQEARAEREGALHSLNCLEFVVQDGSCINLVPLETLHTLPKPGDIVLLPGEGVEAESKVRTGAYQIDRIEHIYTRVDHKAKRPREARLTKAVAHVSSLH